jgi:hypothetical protein
MYVAFGMIFLAGAHKSNAYGSLSLKVL